MLDQKKKMTVLTKLGQFFQKKIVEVQESGKEGDITEEEDMSEEGEWGEEGEGYKAV